MTVQTATGQKTWLVTRHWHAEPAGRAVGPGQPLIDRYLLKAPNLSMWTLWIPAVSGPGMPAHRSCRGARPVSK